MAKDRLADDNTMSLLAIQGEQPWGHKCVVYIFEKHNFTIQDVSKAEEVFRKFWCLVFRCLEARRGGGRAHGNINYLGE